MTEREAQNKTKSQTGFQSLAGHDFLTFELSVILAVWCCSACLMFGCSRKVVNSLEFVHNLFKLVCSSLLAWRAVTELCEALAQTLTAALPKMPEHACSLQDLRLQDITLVTCKDLFVVCSCCCMHLKLNHFRNLGFLFMAVVLH